MAPPCFELLPACVSVRCARRMPSFQTERRFVRTLGDRGGGRLALTTVGDHPENVLEIARRCRVLRDELSCAPLEFAARG
jgi:hypothetical protein